MMAGQSSIKYDSLYSLNEPLVRKLLLEINIRGDEIGWQSSALFEMG